MQESSALAAQPAAEPAAYGSRDAGLWRDVVRRLSCNWLALGGLAVIVCLVLVAIFADLLMPHPYAKIFFGDAQLPPSGQFPLGTDMEGRDTLSRLLYGARVSMSVGMLTVAISTLFGVVVGAFSGFRGGKVDLIVMRLVDIVYTIPALLLAILLMETLGRSLWHLCLAIGIVSWPTIARLVRGQFLSLRERDFIVAARVVGTSDLRIVLRHLLPNALTPIIVAVTFAIPQAIFTEAALSFAGIGINPPTPSWGQMVGQYEVYIQSSPWMSVPPAAAIALTMLAFTFFGDGLRDALDPRMGK